MIQLSTVKKSYQVGNETFDVLKEINLSIEDGEYVSIMGPSGSGKSTLMNIIGCLDRPTTGQYLFHGEDLSVCKDQELAAIRNQSIGFVFQQFQLLPRLNARRNVELPMIYSGIGLKERKERAEHALEKVGLADRMRHMPSELSGGQKQRVAIARAIVNEPKLILADEPTGALDSTTSTSIMEQFTRLNEEGTTVVLVTHEEEISVYTNRTIIVRDGQIVQERMKQGGAGNESI
ncbi:ABC transporter ATP-binding protein [Bacillus sp. NPDC077027]|uniref:ABC transporter ATP-binding protein n=1 Tax=Bacillus sp. NPDC077027 TaxID=3390548 RepID=UPI003D0009F8